MKIAFNDSRFTFLEFGRNKISPSDGEVGVLTLTFDELDLFKDQYEEFLRDLREDDEQHEVTDPMFKDLNYPHWERVVGEKLANFLVQVLNDYLFVEFFSVIFKGKGDKLIHQVLSVSFHSDHVSLELSYLNRKI